MNGSVCHWNADFIQMESDFHGFFPKNRIFSI
jgi:hypothetical protein